MKATNFPLKCLNTYHTYDFNKVSRVNLADLFTGFWAKYMGRGGIKRVSLIQQLWALALESALSSCPSSTLTVWSIRVSHQAKIKALVRAVIPPEPLGSLPDSLVVERIHFLVAVWWGPQFWRAGYQCPATWPSPPHGSLLLSGQQGSIL